LGTPARTIGFATNKDGKTTLVSQFGTDVYDTPKPPALIERMLDISALEPDQFDRVYVNSESAVPGAEPVEVTFKTRMEAAVDGTE